MRSPECSPVGLLVSSRHCPRPVSGQHAHSRVVPSNHAHRHQPVRYALPEPFWLRRKFNPKCTNLDEMRPRVLFQPINGRGKDDFPVGGLQFPVVFGLKRIDFFLALHQHGQCWGLNTADGKHSLICTVLPGYFLWPVFALRSIRCVLCIHAYRCAKRQSELKRRVSSE